MFFMEGTQKKMKLSRKVITHQSFASSFACEIKNNELLITKSFSILIIDKVDVQITKWLHLSFLFSSRLGGGVVWGWLYFINSLQNTQTATQPSCIVKFLKILCSSCIRLILVIL